MKPYTLAEAESELRAALDRSAPAEEITRRGALVDTLDVHPDSPALGSAALWYAEQGIAVFPLRAGGKAPLASCSQCRRTATPRCGGPQECGHDLCHGVLDATTDTDRVRRWWTEHPDSNIGVATGHTFDVVDIDGPAGQQARAEHWCYDEGCRAAASTTPLPASWTPHCAHPGVFNQIDASAIAKVLTPRPGGMHIYVPPTGGGNGANVAQLHGIDYRGKGGYVVAPPSVILPGGKDSPGRYAFLGTPNLTTSRAVA